MRTDSSPSPGSDRIEGSKHDEIDGAMKWGRRGVAERWTRVVSRKTRGRVASERVNEKAQKPDRTLFHVPAPRERVLPTTADALLEAVSTAVGLSAPDFIATAFTKRVSSRRRVSTMVGSTAMLASMRIEW